MTTEPWSVMVRLDAVPETGRQVELEAGEAVRAAVAKAAHVDAIGTLSAAFDLTRRGRDGLRAVGTVRASVRQNRRDIRAAARGRARCEDRVKRRR